MLLIVRSVYLKAFDVLKKMFNFLLSYVILHKFFVIKSIIEIKPETCSILIKLLPLTSYLIDTL